MTFGIVPCENCGRRALVDGAGYCMYCGAPLPPAEPEGVDPQVDALLRMILEGGSPVDDGPWHDLVADAEDLLLDGDVFAARDALLKDLEGRGPEEQRGMKDAMAATAARWVLETVFKGGAYRGGVLPIADLLVVDGEEDTTQPVLLESLFDALAGMAHDARTGAEMVNTIESMLTIAAEYLEAEPSIDRQASMFDSLLGVIGEAEGRGRMSAEEEDLAERLARASEEMLRAMDGGLHDASDEELAGLERRWSGGAGSEGRAASAELRRILDDQFSGSEGDWDQIAETFQRYVDAYRAAGPEEGPAAEPDAPGAALPMIQTAADLLMAGNVMAAREAFIRDAAGKAAEVRAAMRVGMAAAVRHWVIGSAVRGTAYAGGIMALSDILSEDGRKASQAALLQSLFGTLAEMAADERSGADPAGIVESMFSIAADYLEAEPSMDRQASMLEEFLEAANAANGRGSMSGEEEAASERMMRAASGMLDAMDEKTQGMDDERMRHLEEQWSEEGVEEAVRPAADALRRILDAQFDDSEKSWDETAEIFQQYVESYLER